MRRPLILSGTYLGGHPDREKVENPASLRLDETGVSLSVFRRFAFEPWANITAVRAEGPEQIQSRFTATRLLALGPLGLAFKKDKKTACFVVVEGVFGEFIFQVKAKSQQELRGQLAPWASMPQTSPASARTPPAASDRQRAIAPREGRSSPPPGRDRFERLKDLGELRASGVLTDEEFAAEKARILSE